VADNHDVEMELTKVHDLISEEADNHRAKLKASTEESNRKVTMSTFENKVIFAMTFALSTSKYRALFYA